MEQSEIMDIRIIMGIEGSMIDRVEVTDGYGRTVYVRRVEVHDYRCDADDRESAPEHVETDAAGDDFYRYTV